MASQVVLITADHRLPLFLVGLQGPGNECTMSLRRAIDRSPFSEIRHIELERTLMVIATSTVAATGFLIAGALVAMGVLS
ncbi:hypothetical protein C8E83_1953 [Frondihabitans australicus]|uniref:Uncharacterized protein n=1 Tax=Frondihabitans australicus TaxID=386892 RepID=A0A495IFN2_9MICO|nr:hypothetical protein C8E83_1953 [Frondihabitans australicus]